MAADFLEMIKERLEEARARATAAQQAYQAAQSEFQSATNELAIWNNAVNLEVKAREKRAADAEAAHFPMPGIPAKLQIEMPPEEQQSEPPDATSAVNQTEIVRELIRAHEGGMKPVDIWSCVQDSVSSRAYLYSILKRMRDAEEVSVRRGKYIFRPKPIVEVSSETQTVQ